MKKMVARVMAIAALTTGIGAVGNVAFADSANAGTVSQCRTVDAGYGYKFYIPSDSGRYAKVCHVNYDWVEETFFGQRDGFKIFNLWD